MKRDHARSLLERAAEILAYCREQKPLFDGICDRVVAYASPILATRRT